MGSCRSCGARWPEGLAVCPRDGAQLDSAFDLTAPASSDSLAAVALQPAPRDELAPGTHAGDYEILQKLGEGGMGTVYGARHPLIGKRAAIKVIHRALSASDEAVDRFIREAQAVNQIGHPNIVDVFGFGTLPDGRSYFVMEWLLGESLARRLARPLPLAEALEILQHIATALEAAHDAGVLHRDLKPDNVFLQERKGERPLVKLLDFGLAKLSGATELGLERTRTGVVMGTPLYLSPEQAKGQRVDFATDIYSLGAMAYELLCGHVPFKADSAVETMALHISQPVIPLGRLKTEIPPPVDELVLAMLAKDPAQRPPIAIVRARLAALREPGALLARDSHPAGLGTALATSGMALGPAAPARTWHRGIAIAIAAVVLAGGVLAAVLVMRPAAPTVPAAPVVAAPPPVTPPPIVTPIAPSTAPIAPPVAQPDAPSEAANGTDADADADADAVPPEQAAPRAARTGTVVIAITGARRAQITIDGKVVGRGVARLTRTLRPGTHVIAADAAGHARATTTVKVVAGRTHDLTLALEPRKRTHSVDAVHDPFAED